MRINHNIASMITQTSLGAAQKSMSGSLEKLSTGLRINRAADNAAGLAVSEELRTQIRGMAQAKRNAQDGIALLQIAEGAANETSDILQRMRELAVESQNDTLTNTERGYLDQEFQALSSEITRIAQSAQYNGQTLTDGSSSSFGGASSASSVLHIGANGNSGIDQITIGIDGIDATDLGVNSSNVSTSSGASSALTAIDTAIGSVNNMRSDMGAYVNRLDHAINNLSNQEFNTQDAESRIRDVDFATESTNFTRNQILTQSATSMLSQANSITQGALSLIG